MDSVRSMRNASLCMKVAESLSDLVFGGDLECQRGHGQLAGAVAVARVRVLRKQLCRGGLGLRNAAARWSKALQRAKLLRSLMRALYTNAQCTPRLRSLMRYAR